MTTSIQVPTAAFQSCVAEVLRESPFLIDRWCLKLTDAMYQRSQMVADPAERHQIQDAIAYLKKYRSAIEQGFTKGLRKAIAEDGWAPGKGGKPAHSGRSLSSVSFDDLELMGDTQVQQAVESARLHQVVRLGCESGLAEFSARLSTAQGFSVVKGDSNPLRPEIMASALNELLEAIPISAPTRACWLLDGARIMGNELQSLYVSLNDFLANLGIAPAAYGVVGMPQVRSAGASLPILPFDGGDDLPPAANLPPQVNDPHAQRGSANETLPAERKPLLTLDHLHHLLVGDYEDSDRDPLSFAESGMDEPVHQEFSHTVPAALDVLNELREKGLVSNRTKPARHAPPAPVEKLRARLKSDAKTLGQSLAIEVVGLMIEQMANDERLLPPVRQVVADAEPAFLQLAVTDPRFFSEKSHPARRLLDAITSASLAYASESDPGFSEFLHHLQAMSVLLRDGEVTDSDHFARLLHEFERRQNRNTPENRQTQRLAVQALLQAEQRNLMAEKIAAEIWARPDFMEISPVIAAFLTGPWTQVMARERLSGQGMQEGKSSNRFSVVLGDVLWSLDAAHASSHRKRLVQAIPAMLHSLREGLASIDFPAEQSRQFFDELMALHHDGLKNLKETPVDTQKSSHLLEKMFVREEASDSRRLWLAPSEVQHSGFMKYPDEPTGEESPENLLDVRSADAALLPSQANLNERREFNLGDWVDLLVETQWLRAQLTWVSPENTLFMFTSQSGRKHSMTSRVLRHLLELKLIKVVSQQGVLDGALDSVARTALQNSVSYKAGP